MRATRTQKAKSRLSNGIPPRPSFYRTKSRHRSLPGGLEQPPLEAAVFVERPNRFLVIGRMGGRLVRIASSDPGRLEDLLRPGARLLVEPSRDPTRKTQATLRLVRRGRIWVSVVPLLANRLLEAALAAGTAPGLKGARVLRREVSRGRSRFDLLLGDRHGEILTEVKSVTLVARGRALFPDAPTSRGTRHVRELAQLRRQGERTQVVFVVQRSDARIVAPFAERDPDFAAAVADAVRAGVRFRAYGCRVSPAGCAIERRLEVDLSEKARASPS